MKKIIMLFGIVLHLLQGFAQNIGINATGAAPHASAMLDVSSTTKGILIPRMTSMQRIAIVSPANGLLVYDTDNSSFWFYSDTSWNQLSPGSNEWSLSGNAAINPAVHFVGTTDNQPLRFRVNNAWAGEIHPTNKNVSFGAGAGNSGTTGLFNTAAGDHSLFTNTNGSYNSAIGSNTLFSNTTGSINTAHGAYALYNNSTGNNNTATGSNALNANTTGSFNTANGSDALRSNTNGSGNTAIGFQALYSDNSGGFNTANGYQALYTNTTGYFNTASGYQALNKNTTGSYNTAHGYHALNINTTGSYNTGTGTYVLYANSTGTENTAYGYDALSSNSTGSVNTATGGAALSSNTSGNNNTGFGFNALFFNTSGNNNTAVGYNALAFNKGGNNNIAMGYGAGTHGSTPNIYNTISIGNDDMLNAYQNQVFIGNTSTAFIGGKVPWSVISDARVKNTINEDVKGLDFIMRLRPVTYHVSCHAITNLTGNKQTPDFPGKYDGEKIKYSGFLAQEVEQAAKAVGYDFSGCAAPKNQWGLYTLSYEQFVVPLVKAMQEQQKIIEKQQKQIDLLEKKLIAF